MAIRYKKHALFVVSEGLFKDTLVECQGYTDEEGAIFKVIASNIPIHNFNLMDGYHFGFYNTNYSKSSLSKTFRKVTKENIPLYVGLKFHSPIYTRLLNTCGKE